MKQIPKRSEQDPRYTWATTDLFASDDLWRAEYDALEPMADEMSGYAGRLGSDSAVLLEYLRLGERVSERLERLYSYASLCSDTDTGDSKYQNMHGQAVSLMVEFESATAFEAPELMEIPDDVLERFYAEQPALETYRRKLTLLRRMRAHILSAPEEALLAAAGEMANTPDNVGGIFRDADLRFPDAVDSEGNAHPLTQGSFVSLLESPDRTLRKSAFEGLFGTFFSFRNTAAALLDGQMKQTLFYTRARKYGSTLEAALDGNEVPVEVYHRLIDTVRQHTDQMERYTVLRRRLLGLDELHFYDLYTPIVADSDAQYPYEEAKQLVLDALAVLGEDYAALLREAFDHRWIDVYENVGKRSGAYSSGTGRPHPFVLLNHDDTLDSVFTIAHELGHAMHSYLSTTHQPPVNAEYVIFVAEVASTCNEVLLMQHLLSQTTDKRRRAYLINHFLEQFRGTLYRQTMFAEFELFMGQLAEEGESLTADTLSEKYLALNREYYGSELVYDELVSVEWARIPHFFYNYYVFQYATGFSAAIAIAMRILREGAPAVEDYKKFLSSGGSQDPISLLRIAGVDMASPQPIEDALRLFGELLDEMEELLR